MIWYCWRGVQQNLYVSAYYLVMFIHVMLMSILWYKRHALLMLSAFLSARVQRPLYHSHRKDGKKLQNTGQDKWATSTLVWKKKVHVSAAYTYVDHRVTRDSTVTVKRASHPWMTAALNKASSVAMEAYSLPEKTLRGLLWVWAVQGDVMWWVAWEEAFLALSHTQGHNNRTSITFVTGYAESHLAIYCGFFWQLFNR